MRTIVDALFAHAQRRPDRPGVRYLHDGDLDGEVTCWSLSELATRSSSIATWLGEQGFSRGDRALLMYLDGLPFTEAFLGCLVAGVIPVPVSAPMVARLGRKTELLLGIARASTPRAVLTSTALAARARPLLTSLVQDLRVLATDEIARGDQTWSGPTPKLEDVAFLQFTSGSMSAPKGVVVEHRNLSANQQIVTEAHAIHDETHLVSWLPTHHDMGLIGDLLMAVWSGRPLTMMRPQHFIERPMRWLEALSSRPGGRSGGPNFAFALMVRKLDRDALEGLDLSSWETAYCGAEPIRWEVLRDFSEALAPAGFHPRALAPCYGLAEATLYVCGERPWAAGFDGKRGVLDGFTSCGKLHARTDIAIVDAGGRRQADGVEGEIWLRGPTIARGYWGDPAATQQSFGARRSGDPDASWFKTGDLGRVVEGTLYVTGRAKDLIIWRGQNIYPQDIEYAVEGCHPAVRPGCSAAFGVELEDASEGVGVAAEVRRGALEAPAQLEQIVHNIRAAIGTSFGVPVAEVSLLRPRTLLKTTSGKVMRAATRAAISEGSLHTVERSIVSVTDPVELSAPSEGEVMSELLAWVAAATGLSPAHVDLGTSLDALGIDSVRKVELRDHLQARFQTHFELKQLGDDPTLARISSLVRGQVPAATPSEGATAPKGHTSTDAPKAVVLPSLSWMHKT